MKSYLMEQESRNKTGQSSLVIKPLPLQRLSLQPSANNLGLSTFYNQNQQNNVFDKLDDYPQKDPLPNPQ